MIEAILSAGVFIDLVLVIILLLCRWKNKLLPSWFPFSKQLNKWIKPDEYRLKTLAHAFELG